MHLALLLVLLAFPSAADATGAATVAAAGSSTAPAAPRTDVAVFAGGCFWCVETAFEGQPGVLAVVSGYTGGTKERPTYEEVGRGGTGHLEAVEVTYDPARTDYEALLALFWHNVDPTQDDGQFCDRGSMYRSAIFWRTPAQRDAALASKRRIESAGGLGGRPVVTRILPAGRFWPAEAYHQDFWRKDPQRYRSYRAGCGRDARLRQLWGERAGVSRVH